MEIIQDEKLSAEERLKENSNYLRGTILDSLANPLTGSVSPDDAKLLKFHGSYQQHDRDLETKVGTFVSIYGKGACYRRNSFSNTVACTR